MPDEQIRFWQDVPRLKTSFQWLTVATLAFLTIFASLFGFTLIFHVMNLINDVIGGIMIDGVFLFGTVWYIILIIAGIVYLRWLKEQRHPKIL